MRRCFVGEKFKSHEQVFSALLADIIAFHDVQGVRRGLDWTGLQDRHASQLRRKLQDQAKTLDALEGEVFDAFSKDLEAKDARRQSA